MAFPLLGLFGETGSLLSELKKKQRDSASYSGYPLSKKPISGGLPLFDVTTRDP